MRGDVDDEAPLCLSVVLTGQRGGWGLAEPESTDGTGRAGARIASDWLGCLVAGEMTAVASCHAVMSGGLGRTWPRGPPVRARRTRAFRKG